VCAEPAYKAYLLLLGTMHHGTVGEKWEKNPDFCRDHSPSLQKSLELRLLVFYEGAWSLTFQIRKGCTGNC